MYIVDVSRKLLASCRLISNIILRLYACMCICQLVTMAECKLSTTVCESQGKSTLAVCEFHCKSNCDMHCT